VSRSKRLDGVANAAPFLLGHLDGGCSALQVHLFQSLMFMLLVSEVFPDQRFVSPYGLDEVASCPDVLPDNVSLALNVHPRQVNRTLSLDIPNQLRHRILRRDRDHHVHVIGHQMPFLDPTLLLRSQSA
jgi:hypothetical protein